MKAMQKLIPESLKRFLKIRRESKELKRIPSVGGKVECLLSVTEVNLEEIFSSGEIERDWNAIAPGLQTFEIPDGTGGVNPGDGRAIFYLTSYFKPHSVLEVGTHVGSSTVHIAAALGRDQRLENNEPLNLVSVDVIDVNDRISEPWLKRGARHSPVKMIEMLRCGNFVEFITEPSLDYLAGCRHKFDFIFLDGDHAAKTVYQEIPAALELLEKDGLILLHDYFPSLSPLWSDEAVIPGPFLATDRLRTEGIQFNVLPLGQLPWPTKLKSSITSLALLVRADGTATRHFT